VNVYISIIDNSYVDWKIDTIYVKVHVRAVNRQEIYLQLPLLNKHLDHLLARNLIEQEAVPSFHRLINVVLGAHQSVKFFPDMSRSHDGITLATDSD
jgi:hypothetical protein